jgi:predicted regulator of Ras-like GTPase activity (Roadblock/LC7/MglB family)
MTSFGPAAAGAPPTNVAWLLKQFVDEAAGVTHALLVSLDGLQVAASKSVPRDLGDQLAALTAGLLSMANQGGALLGLGPSDHMTIRFPTGHLLFMRVGESAGLAVAAIAGSDLRVLAYQMSQFVRSAGHVLTPPARFDPARMSATPSAR